MTKSPARAAPMSGYVMRLILAELRKQEPLCAVCTARTEIGVSACSYARCPHQRGLADL